MAFDPRPRESQADKGPLWQLLEKARGHQGALGLRSQLTSLEHFVEIMTWRKSRQKEAPGLPVASSRAGQLKATPAGTCLRLEGPAWRRTGPTVGGTPADTWRRKPNLPPSVRNTTALFIKGLGRGGLPPCPFAALSPHPPHGGVHSNKQQERRKPIWKLLRHSALCSGLC